MLPGSDASVREGACSFPPGKHSQHSAEADLLLKCERAAERANTSATSGCLI